MDEYAGFGRMESDGWSDAERARDYAGLFVAVADQALDALVEAIEPSPGDSVLDLCCGPGNVTQALAAGDCRVVGLDFSPAMLALARERAPAACFVEADAQCIPAAAASFDGVVSGFGVCHVPDQPKVLAEVSRVLKPGGRFAMTVWCAPADSPAFDLLYSAIRVHASAAAQLPAGPDFHQFANPQVAQRLLHEAGLRDVRSRVVPCEWRLATPDALFDVFARATVRAGAILATQPGSHRQRIRQAMRDAVCERFASGKQWVVPMPAMLVSARK